MNQLHTCVPPMFRFIHEIPLVDLIGDDWEWCFSINTGISINNLFPTYDMIKKL